MLAVALTGGGGKYLDTTARNTRSREERGGREAYTETERALSFSFFPSHPVRNA